MREAAINAALVVSDVDTTEGLLGAEALAERSGNHTQAMLAHAIT